jgi:hypothetical protein
MGALLAEANSTPVHELHHEPSRQQLMSTPVYELPGERVERELDANGKAEKSDPKSSGPS